MRCGMNFLVMMLAAVCSCAYADTYDFKGGAREGVRFVDQDGASVKLNMKDYPNETFPEFIHQTFVYYIDKIEAPRPETRAVYNESKSLLEKGNNFFAGRDYRNAVRLYDEAIAVNPAYVYAYNNVAVCYFLMGEYGKSIEYCTKLTGREGLNGPAYFYRGVCYMKLEQYARARKDLEMAKIIFQGSGDEQYTRWVSDLLYAIDLRTFPR
jgi:tetratricopeptide (TPR) repeat protein